MMKITALWPQRKSIPTQAQLLKPTKARISPLCKASLIQHWQSPRAWSLRRGMSFRDNSRMFFPPNNIDRPTLMLISGTGANCTSQKRVVANKNLNKRKAHIMNVGKKICGKSSPTSSPQTKIENSFVSETPHWTNPWHDVV